MGDMTPDRKKPGVAFWATVVVVVVLVAYPLSFGAACWITSRLNRGADLVPVLYRPLTWAMSPQRGTAIAWYAKVGAAENWVWAAFEETDETPGRDHTRWKWVEIRPGL
jgi:hypothetical protein